jgi:hypothetical protein
LWLEVVALAAVETVAAVAVQEDSELVLVFP